MSYQQFKDQCLEACLRAVPDRATRRAIGDAAHYVACKNAILAIPLPTGDQSPVRWLRIVKLDGQTVNETVELTQAPAEGMESLRKYYEVEELPLYTLAPDAEAMRKDNAAYSEENLSLVKELRLSAEREVSLKNENAALRKKNDDLRQRIAELESSKALADVAAERRRQIEVEGFTPERDDMYDCHQLSKAAVCYAIYTLAYPPGDPVNTWPWDKSWWKPSEDQRRNRVKAAALLIAEIERLDRIALKGGAA